MAGHENGLILALDTAFDECSAALCATGSGAGARARGSTIVAAISETIGRGHAERLPSVIDRLFEASGHCFADITGIAVTVGPGSFTGVRVGVSAARGYALALAVPVVGLATLHAMAEAVRDERPVLAIHDARRGEVYGLLMAADGDVLRASEAFAPDALAAFVGKALGPEALIDVTGSGARIAQDMLGGSRLRIRYETSRIDIAVLARLAAASRGVLPAKPLYLRGADAKPSSRPFSLFAEKA
ncbi:tRNA (adenosine(37)-N6)-threonylcarbamoyltransferase complex dimerization subunit type 1 TsaB [Fulvimarina sp. 2208YS6-2-32]|uniref:N(6)-L-threonylcarbamoyladenine synthase n=1 Tax=Fulvimarina uroteuthidis TaxID=3098149 RepID=A0ABU5HXI2_9HYPH|nr:tRNA (adenosine(37)-N6)-threonylcarbamoyltransferase complex dimerization subunit type 1 TsaB [Fulvimarina sp. 2208YS6-2-32]MDY8107852.1 tRNA (adenosine(37)-N6)-threonylcarbamoyltransferase complex dimerization subunit type 1 TsaB [Fulvimarina sp. 2208YS6-2-32]